MSPAVYHGPDGLVTRSCGRHGSYVVHALAVAGCPTCRTLARNQRRKRDQAMTCDECGTTLLTPAPRCGFCDPEHNPYAVLAAIDAETSPTPRERQ